MTPPGAEGGALRSQDVLTIPADPATDPLTLDGTIIRVDPDTSAGLPTNPLAGTSSDPNVSRLIAHGLRNPFRFAFRPGTEELWSARSAGTPTRRSTASSTSTTQRWRTSAGPANIGRRGGGSYTYRVCEEGATTACSDFEIVQF